MRKTIKKHPEIEKLTDACLDYIRKQQTQFKRTNSQVPATGKIWFWSIDLKQILSPKHFITWACETFAKNYHDAVEGKNKHLKEIFEDFAEFMLCKISSVEAFTNEDIIAIKSAIYPEAEETLSLTQPLDLGEFENSSDEDSKTPPIKRFNAYNFNFGDLENPFDANAKIPSLIRFNSSL